MPITSDSYPNAARMTRMNPDGPGSWAVPRARFCAGPRPTRSI